MEEKVSLGPCLFVPYVNSTQRLAGMIVYVHLPSDDDELVNLVAWDVSGVQARYSEVPYRRANAVGAIPDVPYCYRLPGVTGITAP